LLSEKIPEEPIVSETEMKIATRIVPVKTPVSVSGAVAPYDSVNEVIKSKDRIVLSKCGCAWQQSLIETGCTKPMEACMVFGFYADYYIDMGWGRRISHEEALDLLDTFEEAGFLHQVPNSIDPEAICNCCPDCCASIRMLKTSPSPAAFANTDHFSQLMPGLCNGCGDCVDHCPMEAISVSADDVAEINLDRCIGCGLCVNRCPIGALMLVLKSEEERRKPPLTDTIMRKSHDIEGTIT
jgi:Na+-translocating ferredoxin:NAD+ oxidoreductase RNF subunit RnfB